MPANQNPYQAVEKPCGHARHSILHVRPPGGHSCRMLKKAVQQGRSERRGEEVRTALRVGRSPFE